MTVFENLDKARKYFECEGYNDYDFENCAGYRCTLPEALELLAEGQEIHTIVGDWEYFTIDSSLSKGEKKWKRKKIKNK